MSTAPASSAVTAAVTAAVDAVLERAVVLATGNPDAKPRLQQASVTRHLWEVSETQGGHGAAAAPTGTGKSLAYLAVAMTRSALYGERSIVSTESLSLQAQVVDKDAPVVAEATHDVLGVRPTVALLKGWSNYVCLRAAKAAVEDILERPIGTPKEPVLWQSAIDEMDGASSERSVLAWALKSATDASNDGDRHSYPHAIVDEQWAMASVTPAECVGTATCPLAAYCKPAIAKGHASKADVIVTNHALLAVQAAHKIAAVAGSKTLGAVDTIIVDEAHALPGQVRNQGAGEVSERRVRSMVRSMERLIQDGAGASKVQQLSDLGTEIAMLVETSLQAMVTGSAGTVARVPDATDPTAGFNQKLATWLDSVGTAVRAHTADGNDAVQIKVRRYMSRVSGMKDALATSAGHTPGIARWVEVMDDGSRSLRYSPVDVSMPLTRNLWTVDDVRDKSQWGGPSNIESEESISDDGRRVPLTVLAVSATLPSTFPAETGLVTSVARYSSPLAGALAASALYVPSAHTKTDIHDLAVPGTAGSARPKFDTKAHLAWARRQIVDLVAFNGGRALVLSATAQAGKEYADALEEADDGAWTVYHQWSGRSLRHVVADWRADETGVLVGTRSLMTGVDAPGDTCSLVIVDRVPRSPSNPVDDARVEDIMARTQIDRWAADRLVYVTDAALLLEQAAGRLVRTSSDRGMVAVLDPRLRSQMWTAFRYPEATRRTYLDAVRHFGNIITTTDDARQFLTALRKPAQP